MTTSGNLSPGTIKTLRILSAVAGVLLILSSLVADAIGMSLGGGFSRNQILITLFGVLLLAAGLLGRRFFPLYRSIAVTLLSIVLLFLLIDLAALAVIKVWNPPEMALHSRKVVEGGLDEPVETPQGSRYTSYVVWRGLPGQQGESTDSDGRRITPGSMPVHDGEGVRIFLAGGSTSWGMGVADSATIAEYLVRELHDSLGVPVELVNLSQIGWASTQELIDLIIELRQGSLPDIVIFLDGFNDVFTAYQSGRAGEHQNFLETAALLENTIRYPGITERIWRTTNLSLVFDLITGHGVFQIPHLEDLRTYHTLGVSADSLAEEVVRICLDNYDLVRDVGKLYDFRCLFFWQPAIWLGDKLLTPEEEIIRAGIPGYEFVGDPALHQLIGTAYGMFDDSLAGSTDGFALVDVFDGVEDRIYTDPSGVHINGMGDSILASRICDHVLTICREESVAGDSIHD